MLPNLILQIWEIGACCILLHMPNLVPSKFWSLGHVILFTNAQTSSPKVWSSGMLSILALLKFGAWSMLYILYMPNLKHPNFGVLSMWCILHMPDHDPPMLRAGGMLYMLHMPNLDASKYWAWACCIFYTWPTLIPQILKIGACSILYTCPTLFLQILELEACCTFWTCPTLIFQIMELGEYYIYLTHALHWSSKFWRLGHVAHLDSSVGKDFLSWAMGMLHAC